MTSNQVNVDPKIIKTTQDSLSKIIKKPILTDKLLKRPPFKFLHDIIINVISSTGFMKDIFTPDDLNPSIQKDKDGKIAFLQKVIDSVGSTLGKPVDVKSAKIVAGLEPDKTNQFLQLLAKAAIAYSRGNKKVESSTSKLTVKNVNKTINRAGGKSKANSSQSGSKGKKASTNGQDGQSTVGNSDNGQKGSQDNLSRINSSVDQSNKGDSSLTNNEVPEVDDDNGVKKSEEGGESGGSNDDFGNENKQNLSDINNQSKLNLHSNITEDHGNESGGENNPEDYPVDAPGENEPVDGPQNDEPQKGLPQLMVRPPTGTQKSYSSRASPRPSARPTTARAAPPKVVTKRELEESSSTDQSRILASSEPVENLIAEKSHSGTAHGRRNGNVDSDNNFDGVGGDDEDDEDAMFVVQEVKDDISSSIESSMLLQNGSLVKEEDKSKGSLVKQLIETKVTLEGSNVNPDQISFDSTGLNKLASRDISTLREKIQRLTQLATPLGRILDYLQEDINSIVTELRGWVEEHARNMVKLQEEKSSIDTHLEPFRVQLEHLDTDIARLHESISIRKVVILKNEEKIERIIKMAVEKS